MYSTKLLLTNARNATKVKQAVFCTPLRINIYYIDPNTGEEVIGGHNRVRQSVLIRAGFYIVYEDKRHVDSHIDMDNLLKLMDLYIHGLDHLHANLDSDEVEKRIVKEIKKRVPTIAHDNLWDILDHEDTEMLYACLKKMIQGFKEQSEILLGISHIPFGTRPVTRAPIKRPTTENPVESD